MVWEVPLGNKYSVLSTENDSNSPADFDVVVTDSANSTVISGSRRFAPNTKKLAKHLKSIHYLDTIPMDVLDDLLSKSNGELNSLDYGDAFLHTLQAQPSLYKASIKEKGNPLEDILWNFSLQHAILRTLVEHKPLLFKSSENLLPTGAILDDAVAMFSSSDDQATPEGSALLTLCEALTDQPQFDVAVAFAIWDLYCMMTAPSIYFDSLKLGHIIGSSLTSFANTSHLFWTNYVLLAWLTSEIGQSMFAAMPKRFQEYITPLLSNGHGHLA
ncbi:unnamed protein product [Aphanomyces euteiches]